MTAIISPYHKPPDPPAHLLAQPHLDSELLDIMVDCYRSSKMLAKMLFPERFYREFDPGYDDLFALLDDDSIQRACVEAFRGCGKTSFVNLVIPAKGILFEDRHFIVPIGCTSDLAVLQTENLKSALQTSEMVKKLFGPMKSGNWAKEFWIAANDIKTAIMPRGAGQPVRGILHGHSRPDYIPVDDLEDPRHIDSDDLRADKKRWFYADLMKAIDRHSKTWRILVIGTILHEDSLIVDLVESPDWESVQMPLCNEDLKSHFPNYMTDEDVKEEFDLHDRADQLDVFYRENRGIPVATKNKAFKREHFKYYGTDDRDDIKITEKQLYDDPYVESLVLIEPARVVSKTAADTAVVGVGVDLRKPAIYVRDVVAGKFFPDQIHDHAFAMASKIGARVLGIETHGLHEHILYPFKNAMMERGLFYEIIDLKPRGGSIKGEGKLERIAGLIPFYRKGQIYHNRSACHGLEEQLVGFPKSKLKDIMDVLGYIVQMLEEGERYFLSYYMTENAVDYDVEEEYKDLPPDLPPLENFDLVPSRYSV